MDDHVASLSSTRSVRLVCMLQALALLLCAASLLLEKSISVVSGISTGAMFARAASPSPPTALSRAWRTDSNLPAASVEAQRIIAEHQNPASCATAQFEVWQCESGSCGLGCVINLIANVMVDAMSRGRVVLMAADCGAAHSDGPLCASHPRNLECFFLPLSRCTLADVRADNTIYSHRLRVHPMGTRPSPLAELTRNLHPNGAQLFARMHCIAYVMRPQPTTLDAFAALAQSIVSVTRLLGSTALSAPTPVAPLLPSAWRPWTDGVAPISVFIRHGDKHSEMKLLPARVYLQNGTSWLRDIGVPTSDPRAVPSMFLGTDDAAAITNATAELPPGWSMLYLAQPLLLNDPINSHAGRMEMLALNMSTSDVFLRQLFEIFVSAHSEALVGTLRSNLCRLMYALRCVWHNATRAVPQYVDLIGTHPGDMDGAITSTAGFPMLRLTSNCPLQWLPREEQPLRWGNR